MVRPQTSALTPCLRKQERLSALGLVYCIIQRKSTILNILPQDKPRVRQVSYRKSEIASTSLAGAMEGISLLKALCKNWMKWLLLQIWRKQHKTTKNMKNQSNMIPQRDHSNLLVNEPRVMKICFYQIKNSNSYFKKIQWNTWKYRKRVQQNWEDNIITKWEFQQRDSNHNKKNWIEIMEVS